MNAFVSEKDSVVTFRGLVLVPEGHTTAFLLHSSPCEHVNHMLIFVDNMLRAYLRCAAGMLLPHTAACITLAQNGSADCSNWYG